LTTVAPALALDGPITVAAATTGTISGTVTATTGGPVFGAIVTVKGPAQASATTDSGGGFSIAVPPGIFSLSVSKGGYQVASLSDIVVTVGQTETVSVALAAIDLSTLRTIGSVTTNTSRSAAALNNGAATESFVGGQQFANLASPQINDVLQHIPDVVIEKMGTQADTSIVVGGLQPYETQVLVDGHPIALGQYGVWLSQYFPSYLIGGAETESGPGNTTPFANVAVAGTVNLTTPSFTTKSTAQFTDGYDNFGSQYSNFLLTGATGPVQYVASAGTAGENGFYFGKNECNVYNFDYTTTPNQPGSAGIVPYCGNFDGSFHTRAMLGKLRVNFSGATTLELGFIGSFGGFSPQGSAWGESYGPTTVEECLPLAPDECTAPSLSNLVGKAVNGFYWFPGTDIQNTQQMWTAQLRTSLGGNTIVDRPYLGAIQPETYVGNGEGGYPAFYAPGPTGPGGVVYPLCSTLNAAQLQTETCYSGPQTLAPGVQIPGTYNNTTLPAPNYFESTVCPTGNVDSFNQINSPSNTIVSVNGQEECFQYPYSTYEQDKLYGNTLSFIHPFGDSFLDLTYDFHGSSTFAYANTPANFLVPEGSATRFSTFSLTGGLNLIRNVTTNFGLYDTAWTVLGSQPIISNGNITGYGGLDRTVSRFDPHIAFVFRPVANTSYRASFGTSETFPFVGDVSGPAGIQPPAFQYTAGLVSEKNPNLLPEYSLAYDAGVDHRLNRNAVLSLDLQDTVVHNVFQQLTITENVLYNNAPALLGVFTPINVALLDARLATLKYTYAPPVGFGFNAAATADRSVLSGIPAGVFNASPGLPANNVQVCGGAGFTPGLATCIPYLKGYGQFTWQWRGGSYAGLGVDYEGKNNPYYQPPFAILDLTVRRPLTKSVEFQFSVQNLLNTNSFNYLPMANAGVPVVGDSSANGTTIQQGSYSTYLIPAPTRTLRLQVRAHLGS
jgi:hypothetical protein